MPYTQLPSLKFVAKCRGEYKCADCDAPIHKGKSRYYIPKSIVSYCDKCGKKHMKE